MGGVRHNLWRTLVTRVAILLLAVQSTIGVAACPHRYACTDVFGMGILCSVYSPATSTDGNSAPARDPSLDCPICMAFCHAATILAVEFVVPAPAGTAVFSNELVPAFASVTPHSPHNRGPPAQSIA